MDSYTVEFDIPRDPEAYRETKHFRYRFNHRTDPEITGDVIKTCISDGRIKTTPASDRRIFEAELDGITWWVIVKVLPKAFYNDNEKHLVLTAYAPNRHSKEKEEWEKWSDS